MKLLDSLTIARQRANAGIERRQRQPAGPEQGEHITSERFNASIAKLQTEITALECKVYGAILVQVRASVGALAAFAGMVVAPIQLLGSYAGR